MVSLKELKSQKFSLNSLKTQDELIIKTLNSKYQFKITDPVSHTGILSGGQLGDTKCRAVWLCTIGNPLETTDTSFKTDTKALFLVEVDEIPTHLCTSSIIALKVVRSADSWKNNQLLKAS